MQKCNYWYEDFCHSKFNRFKISFFTFRRCTSWGYWSYRKDDIVICISKSGQSIEIESLSNYLKNEGVQLIGISCIKDSLLDKLSDMFIHTEIEREACHNNLAPTTSSSCHLAIGDAIAMTLQKIKGFSPNDLVLIIHLET